ncbi:hypothetical protein PCNPT3_00810 [Psychromonas sp. CNPT3]|uniref:DUF4266 domain-containing protein n=1 Tax=Psychromonas sp. CNPT3 TaxID=314282 RepID=UPI00006E7074|nr:DUF4266 domain-containing protein [Psychromonas sp. CNPT3]AGH80104.1 hypothetical protein PCNPT3_00810 [Psychromonas sp. CNPT3]
MNMHALIKALPLVLTLLLPPFANAQFSIDLSNLNNDTLSIVQGTAPQIRIKPKKIQKTDPRYQISTKRLLVPQTHELQGSVATTKRIYYQQSESTSFATSARAITKSQNTSAKPIVFNFVEPHIKNKEIQAEKPSKLAFIERWLGIKKVQAWEKGVLAKKEMKPGGLAPEFGIFSNKVFSYKQSSLGGNGVSGGGCGCN